MSNHVASIPDPFTDIRITALQTLRGANYWSHRPITRMDVHIGAYENISSADVACVTEQLVAALPGLIEHRCSVGTRGGFIERLRDGTYVAHIIEHVALELQSMIGQSVGYGRTRGTGTVGEYTVAFAHIHAAVGLRAATLALETVQCAFACTLHSVDHAIAELRAAAKMAAPAPIRQRVVCGMTGGTGRMELRTELVKLGVRNAEDEALFVDVSPAYLLQAGLPYAQSDIAVILDVDLTDVPERYRDPERAARLMSIVADAVPIHGGVVCPDHTHYVHDLVRDAQRRIVKFAAARDVTEHVRRAARAAASLLETSITEHHAR